MTSAPAQGRRPPATPDAGIDIACDESGYEGEKLVDGTTDVFVHGSVAVDSATAAECMAELRCRIRSPATEYKANHLLRHKHRDVLIWLLGPDGPLRNHSHVCLVDKSYFAVVTMVRLLGSGSRTATGLHQPPGVTEAAAALYRARTGFRPDHWGTFLIAGNDIVRARNRRDVPMPVDAFFHMVDLLRNNTSDPNARTTLDRLADGRATAEQYRTMMDEEPDVLPIADPLLPGVIETVRFWSGGDQPVHIVHDRQNALSPDRIAALRAAVPGGTGTGLSTLVLVDSFGNPRVQLADILAGTIRKIASEHLNGRGDPELTALLAPYLTDDSLWCGRLPSAAPDRSHL